MNNKYIEALEKIAKTLDTIIRVDELKYADDALSVELVYMQNIATQALAPQECDVAKGDSEILEKINYLICRCMDIDWYSNPAVFQTKFTKGRSWRHPNIEDFKNLEDFQEDYLRTINSNKEQIEKFLWELFDLYQHKQLHSQQKPTTEKSSVVEKTFTVEDIKEIIENCVIKENDNYKSQIIYEFEKAVE